MPATTWLKMAIGAKDRFVPEITMCKVALREQLLNATSAITTFQILPHEIHRHVVIDGDHQFPIQHLAISGILMLTIPTRHMQCEHQPCPRLSCHSCTNPA